RLARVALSAMLEKDCGHWLVIQALPAEDVFSFAGNMESGQQEMLYVDFAVAAVLHLLFRAPQNLDRRLVEWHVAGRRSWFPARARFGAGLLDQQKLGRGGLQPEKHCLRLA